jgi:hypothetical protein
LYHCLLYYCFLYVHLLDYPLVHLLDYRSPSAGLGVVREMDIQETVEQETGLQETATPQPPSGDGDSPPIEGVALPDSPSVEQPSPVSPPPTPSPSRPPSKRVLGESLDAIVGSDRILDHRSRKRLIKDLGDTGWGEYPDRMRRLRKKISETWMQCNPTRVNEVQLDLLLQYVRPDEADLFVKSSMAYVRSLDDRTYIWGLQTWLKTWRTWKAPAAAPRSMAEAMVLQEERRRKEA